MNILETITERTKERIRGEKKQIPINEIRKKAEEKASSDTTKFAFEQALRAEGLSFICEAKKASPSKGLIAPDFPYVQIAQDYEAGGAAAISCLTEEDHFHGSIDYLKYIRGISPLPILRKDFMIDEYQFYEAKAIGADAVLLIAAILDDAQMRDFYQLAKELSLDSLVEVHNEEEMERALKLDAEIIGVNNRNLKDFTIELDTTRRLSKMVSEEKVFVAESGIITDEDVRFLKQCKVDAFLIGRALMEAEHPAEVAAHWKELA